MGIADWPAAERPRERLLTNGPESLSDAELLAIFLRVGRPGCSAVEMARELLGQFGSLRGLLNADFDRFTARPGLGPAKYVQLKAVMEMARRNLLASLGERPALSDPAQAKRYFTSWLRDRQREVFAALFLDNRHRVLRCEALSVGTIDGASVYPREVVRRCLELGAAAVVFAHNHPSGVAEPSDADRRITRRLRDALGLIDVRVLDHLVVGDGEVVSFAERGLL